MPCVCPSFQALITNTRPSCRQTLVTWNIFAAPISPVHFHRPREFIPERWLDPQEPVFDADCREVHEPFSRGPRSCIGKQ
ncbi:cytochrome P450 [Candidatus Bathyarchaeota archaeon]|nr:cytochrome P450 [Candidatus Bathyarchaeota archaeon]